MYASNRKERWFDGLDGQHSLNFKYNRSVRFQNRAIKTFSGQSPVSLSTLNMEDSTQETTTYTQCIFMHLSYKEIYGQKRKNATDEINLIFNSYFNNRNKKCQKRLKILDVSRFINNPSPVGGKLNNLNILYEKATQQTTFFFSAINLVFYIFYDQ